MGREIFPNCDLYDGVIATYPITVDICKKCVVKLKELKDQINLWLYQQDYRKSKEDST